MVGGGRMFRGPLADVLVPCAVLRGRLFSWLVPVGLDTARLVGGLV